MMEPSGAGGAKVHMAVDTLGHLLALHVTPANEQDRARVKALATQVQAATGETMQVAFGDQGYTGKPPAQDAAQVGITLAVVKLPAAETLLADKGYDSDRFRAALTRRDILPCIPGRGHCKNPIAYDPALYKHRNRIERMFDRLKDWRRIATPL